MFETNHRPGKLASHTGESDGNTNSLDEVSAMTNLVCNFFVAFSVAGLNWLRNQTNQQDFWRQKSKVLWFLWQLLFRRCRDVETTCLVLLIYTQVGSNVFCGYSTKRAIDWQWAGMFSVSIGRALKLLAWIRSLSYHSNNSCTINSQSAGVS